MQHLDNLRLQIPLFRLAAEPDDPLDPRVASAEADDGEQGVEHVHYLLYTADDKVPSPLPADMLQYVRTASLLQDKASNLESAVEGASMRAWELFGYDRGDWVRKKTCVICRISPREAAFLPCGHTACCFYCAKRAPKCPTCREDFHKVRRLSQEEQVAATAPPSPTSSPGSPVTGDTDRLPQPFRAEPKPLALEYAVHVPKELNPKILFPDDISLNVKHAMKLGARPRLTEFPSPLLVPLTVKRQYAKPKPPASVRGLRSQLMADNVSKGEWELAVGVRPYASEQAV